MQSGDGYFADRIMADQVQRHGDLARERHLATLAKDDPAVTGRRFWSGWVRLSGQALGNLAQMLECAGRQIESFGSQQSVDTRGQLEATE